MGHRHVSIDVYTALITGSHLYVRGRLLANRLVQSREYDGYFVSLINTFRRIVSAEISGATVFVDDGQGGFDVVTDDEGYFEILVLKKNHTSSLVLKTEHRDRLVTKRVVVDDYSHGCREGIISDIDDTVMHTRVTSFLRIRMLINSLFINPFRRKPIKSAAQYYHQIIDEMTCRGVMVYISNSPWNLYGYLRTFLEHHRFPRGILQLRDFGRQMLRRRGPLESSTKYLEIEKTLRLFGDTAFILAGDAGEKDFDIYYEIKRKYPDRITQIIIVRAGNHANEKRIAQIIQSEKESKVRLISTFDEVLKKKGTN